MDKVPKGGSLDRVDCAPGAMPSLYGKRGTSAALREGGWWFTSLAQWDSVSAKLSGAGRLKDVPAGFLNCRAPAIAAISSDIPPGFGATLTVTTERFEGVPTVSVEYVKGGKAKLKRCKTVSLQTGPGNGSTVITALYPELPTVKDATEGPTGYIVVSGKNGVAAKRAQPVRE